MKKRDKLNFLLVLGYPKDIKCLPGLLLCIHASLEYIHYLCTSVFLYCICLAVCQTAVFVGGRDLAPPLGVVNFFYCASFQQLFAYFYRPKTTGPSTHITVYIFYKFGPSLGSISQSVLSHLALLSRRCLCFSYFSSSSPSSSSSTSHLQQPQHFTIPL